MSTSYGPTVNHWRAYVDYVASTTSTQVKVLCSGIGMESVAYGFSIGSGITSYVSLTGSSWHPAGTGGFSSGYGATVKKNFIPDGNREYAFNRTHNTYTAYVTNQVTNASGYMNGTSTATVAVNVPAKTSWTVSYNENGGSGAPGAQTKWYGEGLVLSSTRPTWDGHTFHGWATSQGGPPVYQPGGSYTVNGGAILYAVWSVDYVAPTISNLSAFRCSASGAASEDGTRAKVSVSWSVDTTVTPGNAAAAVAFSVRERGTTEWSSASTTASGTSGTTTAVLAGTFAAETSYDVMATITDTAGGSASATTIVASAFFTLDFAAGGKGVGVGCASPTSGLSVAMDTEFSGAVAASQLNGHSLPSVKLTTMATGVTWYCANGVCTVTFGGATATLASWGSKTYGTLPAEVRPPTGVYASVSVDNCVSHTWRAGVLADGTVEVRGRGGAALSGEKAFWATISYPVW